MVFHKMVFSHENSLESAPHMLGIGFVGAFAGVGEHAVYPSFFERFLRQISSVSERDLQNL